MKLQLSIYKSSEFSWFKLKDEKVAEKYEI